jgi:hypothetical protein
MLFNASDKPIDGIRNDADWKAGPGRASSASVSLQAIYRGRAPKVKLVNFGRENGGSKTARRDVRRGSTA